MQSAYEGLVVLTISDQVPTTAVLHAGMNYNNGGPTRRDALQQRRSDAPWCTATKAVRLVGMHYYVPDDDDKTTTSPLPVLLLATVVRRDLLHFSNGTNHFYSIQNIFLGLDIVQL